ncbi:MAG: hypothetical protein ACQESK_07740 [Bacteroidota bacterium]
MSFGAGHIHDMIIRLRNNRSQLPSQKQRNSKNSTSRNNSAKQNKNDLPKFTAAQVEQTKKKFAKARQKERKTEWIIYGTSIVLSAIICWLIYSYVDLNAVFLNILSDFNASVWFDSP